MSDANRLGLSYIRESVYGTTPATPTMQAMRFVNESLNQDTKYTNSNEIRSDRQIPDFIRTGLSVGGDVAFEFSYGTYDEFLQSSLQAASLTAALTTIAPASTVILTVTASGSNWLITASGTGSGTLFSGISSVTDVGRWMQFKGGLGAPGLILNGFHKIVTTNATTTLTVTSATLSATAYTVGTDTFKMIGMSYWVNGTTFYSYSFEKTYLDLASEFAVLTGCSPSQFAFNVAADQIITGSFTFLGKREVSGSSTVASTLTAATTTNVMNGIDSVVGVLEGATTSLGHLGVTGFSLALNNNLRERLQVATLGPISIGSGTINLTGTLRAYYSSKTIYDEYLNAGTTNLAIKFSDSVGNSYVIDLPRVKFTAGKRVAGGINTDIIADMNFAAFLSPTELITARISKILGSA